MFYKVRGQRYTKYVFKYFYAIVDFAFGSDPMELKTSQPFNDNNYLLFSFIFLLKLLLLKIKVAEMASPCLNLYHVCF